MAVNPELPELLCPAGDLQRLKTALVYGADAIYLGGQEFNLRSKARGFSHDELELAVSLARNSDAKIYYCLNALPLEKDMPGVKVQLEMVSGVSPDALIVADPGVISLARQILPDTALHLSTQANTCNSYSLSFWKEQGIKRINLSRELGIRDIRAINERSLDMELEMFVHGAMCMAISGRCFLSAYLNARSANQGLCAHPCRYEYKPCSMDLEEKTRPGYPVWNLVEDHGYSKIFSAEDLCLAKYLPWLVRNRINSLKIEGRTKSASYLAIVTDVYRTALDDFSRNHFRPGVYLEELSLVSTRPLGTGFFLKNKKLFSCSQKAPERNGKILARIERRISSSKWLIQVKEKWPDTLDIQLVLPGLRRPAITSREYGLEDESGQGIEVANPGIDAVLRCDHELIEKNIFIRSGCRLTSQHGE